MASSSNVPISIILKKAKDEEANGDEPKKKSREDWKKEKELEELRKAGSIPAAVDEEGKDINPHIPQYISAAPWYYNSQGPTLKHQRQQDEYIQVFTHLNEHYTRGLKGSKSNKYRKGACENCGAMGHNKKDCFERPRKVGAKFTNREIASDDVMLPKLDLDFDGKRDRWNGFDAAEYKAVVEEHEKIEEFKRKMKAQKLKDGQESSDEEAEDDDEEDEDKYAEDFDMPGTKVDSKQRITVRNLRIREDTAKYLRNLDPNSAHYDPKTRSMRTNPYQDTGKKPEEVDFAGENFVRFTGDTIEQAKAQSFAWEAYEQGVDVSLLAEPTKLEMLKKQFNEKREEFKGKISSGLLEKYGGKEHLKVPPRQLLLAQSEDYVEYSRQGKVIKGAEKEVIRSRYEEDVHPNNHSSVWGSYWHEGRWGYKCCHSLLKNSYCTGEAGKTYVAEDLLPPVPAASDITVDQESKAEDSEKLEEKKDQEKPKTLVEIHREKMEEKSKNKKKKKSKKKRKKRSKKESSSSSSSSSSESEEELSKEELRKKKKKSRPINYGDREKTTQWLVSCEVVIFECLQAKKKAGLAQRGVFSVESSH
ncbi:Pre-mRNA splicing Prp18-interacting factor [Trinorchestia longiramus]|nr:Pre-mRNA splicing Prp18-interacting factor [Trinorchestia longiramus]